VEKKNPITFFIVAQHFSAIDCIFIVYTQLYKYIMITLCMIKYLRILMLKYRIQKIYTDGIFIACVSLINCV